MDNPTPISGGEIAAGGGSTTTSPAPSQPAYANDFANE
jgi:hypothetical protein